MNDLTKNYTYFLKILFSGCEEEYVCKVRSDEADRFETNLESIGYGKDANPFFVGDTIDGKVAGINLKLIQSVHILWEPSHLPEDNTHFYGSITFKLKGRKEVVESNTDIPDELALLFNFIQLNSDVTGDFISFIDDGGEKIYINRNELLYIEAPLDLVDEGYKILEEETQT